MVTQDEPSEDADRESLGNGGTPKNSDKSPEQEAKDQALEEEIQLKIASIYGGAYIDET